MVGKGKNNSSTKTKICSKCGLPKSVYGFANHERNCTGDPNRPRGSGTTKKRAAYDKKHGNKAGETSGTEISETEPPIVENPVNTPKIHTTVPLNPSTNEHGGIVENEQIDVPKIEGSEEVEDDEDNEEWDGYLC